MATVLRTTARLDEDEADFTARLRRDTYEAEAARRLTGAADLRSAPAATLVHTIIAAGIKAIREEAEEISRQRLVEHLETDQEHQTWRASRLARGALRHSYDA